jgi:hypothetical protein
MDEHFSRIKKLRLPLFLLDTPTATADHLGVVLVEFLSTIDTAQP